MSGLWRRKETIAFAPSVPMSTLLRRVLPARSRVQFSEDFDLRSGPQRCRCGPQAFSVPMMTHQELHRAPVLPLTQDESTVRPRSIKSFRVPYANFVIRAWQEQDCQACVNLIDSVLGEYGLVFDPSTSDRDVVEVLEAYQNGEFWVVEDVNTSTIVGTAAFYEVPHRGEGAIEMRKLYLSKTIRGRGLGSFLLSALEQRTVQLGYTKVYVETVSILKEAYAMYKSRGYVPSSGLETERCDVILEKPLRSVQLPEGVESVEVVDLTRGWTITCIPRQKALEHRILYRAVVVLVESSSGIYVHRRSMKKSTYPGHMAVFVTGVIDWMERPMAAAKREVMEELGLSHLEFSVPFLSFIPRGRDRLGPRIWFHPFVARGDFAQEDIVFDPDEVDGGQFMSREQINEKKIGGSLWQEFRSHGF